MASNSQLSRRPTPTSRARAPQLTPPTVTSARDAQPPQVSTTPPSVTPTPAMPSRSPAKMVPPRPDNRRYETIDRAFKANLARLTFGLSPAVLAEQTFDWLVHLAVSPGKQLQLIEDAAHKAAGFWVYAAQSANRADWPLCVAPWTCA